jgi:hypothetical protein
MVAVRTLEAVEWETEKTAGREVVLALLAVLVVALAACFAVNGVRPPKAVAADAPVDQFSSARAMTHLRNIAVKPHPVGAAEHGVVRDYILRELSALGLTPKVQATTSVNAWWSTSVRAAKVQNIVAKMPGAAPSKAVMLVSHYDSAPTSPGASDDGSGVTAMLETARALKAGAQLKRDVILLFTDGEELGLLGAKAFVDEHPLMKEVGIVFNFEARGSGGPAFMFETSDGNGGLVREFAAAAPHPIANSLGYEIYKRLPNDTDMTIFKKAGLAGLNFAYIGDVGRYHNVTDSTEHIDERSLQHQGSYALALTRHFGNLTLSDVRENNAVFFNPVGALFVNYPGALVLPLMILSLLVYTGAVVLGFKTQFLTARGIVFGFVALLIAGLAAVGIVWLATRLVTALHSGYDYVPYGEPHNSELYVVSFLLLTLGMVAALYNWFRTKTSDLNLAAGGLLWWFLLSVPVSRLAPGASYLLTWPLLFASLGLAAVFAMRARQSVKTFAIVALCLLPGVLLFSQMIYLFYLAMMMTAGAVLVVPAVMLLGLLLPLLAFTAKPRRWVLPAAALLVALGLAAAGVATAGFDRNNPRNQNIFYGLNADTGAAVWASGDPRPDEWTSQFISANAEPGSLPDFFPVATWSFIKGEAVALPLPAPTVEVLGDELQAETRTIRLLIRSQRKAPVATIYVEGGDDIAGAYIDGKSLTADGDDKLQTNQDHLVLHYHGLPEDGVELKLVLKSSRLLKIRVNDRTFGLPEIPGANFKPRPDYMMPISLPYSDATFVTKTFSF